MTDEKEISIKDRRKKKFKKVKSSVTRGNLVGKKKYSIYEEATSMWQDQKGKKYITIFITETKDCNS